MILTGLQGPNLIFLRFKQFQLCDFVKRGAHERWGIGWHQIICSPRCSAHGYDCGFGKRKRRKKRNYIVIVHWVLVVALYLTKQWFLAGLAYSHTHTVIKWRLGVKIVLVRISLLKVGRRALPWRHQMEVPRAQRSCICSTIWTSAWKCQVLLWWWVNLYFYLLGREINISGYCSVLLGTEELRRWLCFSGSLKSAPQQQSEVCGRKGIYLSRLNSAHWSDTGIEPALSPLPGWISQVP